MGAVSPRERPAPPRWPWRYCPPPIPSHQPTRPPGHWDQLGVTGISTRAGITSSVSTARAGVLRRGTARCQTHPHRTTVRHQPSLCPHRAWQLAAPSLWGHGGRPVCHRHPLTTNATVQARSAIPGDRNRVRNRPRGAVGLCVCPQGAAPTLLPLPRGREGAEHRSVLGITPGGGTGIPSVPKARCPQQPPLQPIRPRERPGMKNLISKLPAQRGTET